MNELLKFIKEYKAKNFQEVLKEEKIDVTEIKEFQNFATINKASVNEKDRTIEVIATKEVIDRQGDMIKVNGINIEKFIKNPVVPFGHDYSELPVAKGVGIRFEGDELLIKLQFPTKAVYEKGDTVFKMIKEGYLNAVSIGFIPIKQAWDDEIKAYVIEKSELLEVSIVPVPANQDALIRGFKALKTVEDIETPDPEEKEVKEDEPEEINEKIVDHNKTMIKIYRKYQVQLRDVLQIDATEDEEETAEKVFNSVIGVCSLVKDLISDNQNKTNSDDDTSKEEENQPQDEESLAEKALKGFSL